MFLISTDDLCYYLSTLLLLLLIFMCYFASPKDFPFIQSFPLEYKSEPTGGELMKEKV